MISLPFINPPPLVEDPESFERPGEHIVERLGLPTTATTEI